MAQGQEDMNGTHKVALRERWVLLFRNGAPATLAAFHPTSPLFVSVETASQEVTLNPQQRKIS
jgi:hypothetical protein